MKTPLAVSLAKLVLFLGSAFMAFDSSASAEPPQYLVTVLGSVGNASYACGINASAQVAGYADIRGNGYSWQAVRWTGTTPTLLNGADSQGFGINDSGQVAGWSSGVSSNPYAVRWTGTTPTFLDGTYGRGFGINESGQVAGWLGNFNANAVRWTSTTLTFLATPGGPSSQGFGINDSEQVAGWISVGNLPVAVR